MKIMTFRKNFKKDMPKRKKLFETDFIFLYNILYFMYLQSLVRNLAQGLSWLGCIKIDVIDGDFLISWLTARTLGTVMLLFTFIWETTSCIYLAFHVSFNDYMLNDYVIICVFQAVYFLILLAWVCVPVYITSGVGLQTFTITRYGSSKPLLVTTLTNQGTVLGIIMHIIMTREWNSRTEVKWSANVHLW